MTTEKIINIEIINYSGDVYNLEVEPTHEEKDDQFYLCADTGIVIHNCHPRDNIALRWLSENLNLGYDLFGTIMKSREIQAKNLAEKLMSFNLPIVILGKSYKPNVLYDDGSYSILVGSFINDHELFYDIILDKPAVYLLAHPKKKINISSGSIVVDPWRQVICNPGVKVVYYGNTRY